jgi:hypothetical protein
MEPNLPFLLVRATPRPDATEDFAHWFRHVHLRDAGRVPGFKTVQSGRTSDGAFLGIYTLADPDAVQQALGSPEAMYARGAWEQWSPRLRELIVEMYAPLPSMRVFEHRN